MCCDGPIDAIRLESPADHHPRRALDHGMFVGPRPDDPKFAGGERQGTHEDAFADAGQQELAGSREMAGDDDHVRIEHAHRRGRRLADPKTRFPDQVDRRMFPLADKSEDVPGRRGVEAARPQPPGDRPTGRPGLDAAEFAAPATRRVVGQELAVADVAGHGLDARMARLTHFNPAPTSNRSGLDYMLVRIVRAGASAGNGAEQLPTIDLPIVYRAHCIDVVQPVRICDVRAEHFQWSLPNIRNTTDLTWALERRYPRRSRAGSRPVGDCSITTFHVMGIRSGAAGQGVSG